MTTRLSCFKSILIPNLSINIAIMKPFLYLLIISLMTACEKSNSEKEDKHPAGVPTTPETKPQYNNTSFGVYKGVVLGSTGILIIRINNGDNEIKAYLTIDNQKDTLSNTQTLIPGQAIVNLQFVGRISSMSLSANADGSEAQINNLTIVGHPNASAIVVHENSTHQVLLYEGTFSGDISGRINFIKVGTSPRTEPVDYIAKASTDNYFIRGRGLAELDSGSRTHTHYIHDIGGYQRSFTGYMTFDLSKGTGSYVSYVHLVGTYNGLVDCKRTY